LGGTLAHIRDYLSSKNYAYEIIVVDDGSSDGTAEAVKESALFKDGRIKLISNGINRGKGFSVRRGIAESRGEYVLLTDADMSTPVEETEKLLKALNEGIDIAIGSRSVSGSDVRVHQAWYRELMGKTFNLFVKLLIVGDFKDTQCGFKLLKGAPARKLAEAMRINGFCFDVEMLYLAGKKGSRIKEVGVIWDNSPQSKVKVIDSSVGMFLDLFRIRLLHR
jgi:dolichyl-phosphate beta-glucosyltransferase